MRNLPTKAGFAWKSVAVCLFLGAMVVLLAPRSASADPKSTLEKFWTDSYGNNSSVVLLEPDALFGFKGWLLAKAQPDECFQGLTNPNNSGFGVPSPDSLSFVANYPGDLTGTQIEQCLNTTDTGPYLTQDGHAQPKTNQAYIWGLTQFGNKLWFGTIANTHCLVISGYLQSTEPSLNHSWVCEGGAADFRPPRIFYYDTSKKELNDVTASILSSGPPHAGRLLTTIGIRSAGSAGRVAFLGGISINPVTHANNGINIFAFDAKTADYLGLEHYDDYTNIRQWRLINNELYVGVAKSDGTGEILRWTGKLKGPIFSFETVGTVGGDPAYLTHHEDRIFVSTWPDLLGSQEMSIYMSPEMGSDGKLTSADSAPWEQVWKISNYDPEPSVVYTTGGGALMSYEGYLYWGTMHVPGVSLLAWEQLYNSDPDNPAPDADAQAALLGTYRAISVFRGKDFGTGSPAVELLYGNTYLPKYTPESGWQIVSNNMGQTPRYGLAGFNNFFNNYTWWMEVFQDQLFVGTMDFSYLIGAQLGELYDFPDEIVDVARRFFGADLYRFTPLDIPAIPVSLNGVGNYTNYGIRTMVSTEYSLYLGTANPMNLMTDPSEAEGGWELLKVPSSQ